MLPGNELVLRANALLVRCNALQVRFNDLTAHTNVHACTLLRFVIQPIRFHIALWHQQLRRNGGRETPPRSSKNQTARDTDTDGHSDGHERDCFPLRPQSAGPAMRKGESPLLSVAVPVPKTMSNFGFSGLLDYADGSLRGSVRSSLTAARANPFG